MRLLESKELIQIKPVLDKAIEQAKLSPCQKSKRGAVVFKDSLVLGVGNNAPPEPLWCNPEICRAICAKYTVHAEQNAVFNALNSRQNLADASIFHIKVNENGLTVPSNDLSCPECSRLVLRFHLKEFILFQDAGYMGLYGGLRQKDIHQKKKLKEKESILDRMGSEELAANLFRATQTQAKLKRENIQGENKANQAHYSVGKKIRQTIQELGGTMPEKLQTPEHIKESKKRLKKSTKALIED